MLLPSDITLSPPATSTMTACEARICVKHVTTTTYIIHAASWTAIYIMCLKRSLCFPIFQGVRTEGAGHPCSTLVLVHKHNMPTPQRDLVNNLLST